jgi:hypothetical protein
MPENWWARYVSWFWYAPFLFIIPANFSGLKRGVLCLALFTILNSGLSFIFGLTNGINSTRQINKFVQDIQKSPEENITICLPYEYFQYSVLEKLRQEKIQKKFVFIEDDKAKSNYPGTFIQYWERTQ